ncbi:hypothetical protein FRB95_001880 [Tulasnella sp. JGI-2019a]|nr:hypothetical protein FRB95_001880 [Tulasnella sp. JGI-2019a]
MVNWTDPATILAEATTSNEVVIAFLGLVAWEIIVSFSFDLEVLFRQRDFKWSMVLYWAAKYSVLFTNIGVTIFGNAMTKINCQALYTFNQLFGNIAIGTASALLMLHTIAIWSRSRNIMYPLMALFLGQWAIIIYNAVTVSASWSSDANACVIKAAPMINLKLIYIYATFFDLTMLTATITGLCRLHSRTGETFGNRLSGLLLKDGVIFFLVVFASNLVALVFVLANLNPIMNVVSCVPAASIASIASCRLFVRLTTHIDFDPTVVPVKPEPRSGTHGHTVRKAESFSGRGQRGDTASGGVHVRMNTFASHAHPRNVTFDSRLGVQSQNQKGGPPYAADNGSFEDLADEKPSEEL